MRSHDASVSCPYRQDEQGEEVLEGGGIVDLADALLRQGECGFGVGTLACLDGTLVELDYEVSAHVFGIRLEIVGTPRIVALGVGFDHKLVKVLGFLQVFVLDAMHIAYGLDFG